MTGAVLILRPQPGADETAARARARELEPVVAPLFTIRPVDWTPPPVDRFDAILFTSANGARHGGPGLAAFQHLPCYAVGEATAAAARAAGFANVRVGPSDAAAVAAMMAADGIGRAFHPAAAEPAPFAHPGVEIDRVPVYIALPAGRLSDIAVAAIHAGAIVLLHSPRAAEVFGDLVGERRAITRIVAISEAAAEAAETGWAGVAVAAEPRDEALLSAAQAMVPAAAADRDKQRGETPAPPPPPPPPKLQPPRSRPWAWQLTTLAIAFLLGMVALVWVLLRWDGVGTFLGIVPQAIDPANQPEAVEPQRPQAAAPAEMPLEGDVARRVALLEQRLGELGTDARSAVGNADRAEGLLVAFAARRALERGVGLGYLEGLLRQRFGESQAQSVATIVAFSQQPVTLQQLQAGLVDVGPRLTGVAPGQSFWQALQAEMADLIIIRREGTVSTDPRERLQRATSRLEAGQVEEALREVLRMPGRESGRAWIEAAQRYVAARQALDTIELAALVEPRMPPPQPTPAAAPAQPGAPQQPATTQTPAQAPPPQPQPQPQRR
jgi:uroporphyrinogen-III synthase